MIPTICTHCWSRLEVDAACADRPVLCGICQQVFTAIPADTARRPVARVRRRTWDDDDWEPPRRRRRTASSGDGAIFALVLGIVSVCIFCLWPIGMITSGIGMTLGARALPTRARAMAVTGLVLSTVGMIFAVGFAVVTVAAVAKFGLDDGIGSVRTQPTLKNRR